MQTQRFEMKYLISEETALAARRYLRCFLVPDEFAKAESNFSYPVHSLYLDSPNLETYRAVQSGDKNRFKLRIRYYSNSDKAVYFEIKRRTNECISKMRAKVRREAVREILAGQPPQMKHLASNSAKDLFALQEFCRLMHKLDATPVSHVAYQREAWMSRIDNSMRITFDRQVQCEPEFGTSLKTEIGAAVSPFNRTVILELKFTNRLPGWCGDMVRSLSLARGGAPKYVLGVMMMGEERISNSGVGIKVKTPAVVAPRPITALPQTEPLAVPAS